MQGVFGLNKTILSFPLTNNNPKYIGYILAIMVGRYTGRQDEPEEICHPVEVLNFLSVIFICAVACNKFFIIFYLSNSFFLVYLD